jgi:hypothetical protein
VRATAKARARAKPKAKARVRVRARAIVRSKARLRKSKLSPKEKCMGMFLHALKMYGEVFTHSQISNHSKAKKTTKNSWLNRLETNPKSLSKSELSLKEKCIGMFSHALKMCGEVFACPQISNHSKAKKTTENSWLNGPETSPG